ncbi:flagellar motor stator protein MotA [Paenirhodobacter hankyongi]|uniref:Flagellar motor stator protein MotA n=1 Tax=Paenirhodobacter hankyongi TaxID=2294033 RepID=A0A421BLZ6_9RHOB|nr:flagellar motor stator protein MotA [Sinirhodobacter hankyongi]RLL64083.1 flagellar motor stator protein MotA [Sinirhodobacter hankyongi]
MIGIVGMIVIFVMVFGGFVAAGGKIGIILKALPFELIMIGGAAAGSFLLSNDLAAVKRTLRDMGKVFKGPIWQPADYRDLLCLLFELIRLVRQNPVAIEEHIEAPESSSIFQKYPKILKDHEAIEMICDTMRAASMNYDDPHQVEEILDKQLEANFEHAMHSSHAIQTVADAMPALGIVAAVLGVIKTMAAIDQPPEILGHMIGGALVGTFLGVFLAYGFVGPFASRIGAVIEEDSHFYKLIREVLVANLYNHATNICIEVGRQNTPHHIRPSFSELEEALRTVKAEAA